MCSPHDSLSARRGPVAHVTVALVGGTTGLEGDAEAFGSVASVIVKSFAGEGGDDDEVKLELLEFDDDGLELLSGEPGTTI